MKIDLYHTKKTQKKENGEKIERKELRTKKR